jgi:centractin
MMIEKFNVSGIFFAMQAVLSLYAAGHTTGVVLDSGDGVTHAVPIYEGFAITHGITRVDIAGRDVTDQMQLLLRGSGHVFSTTAETEIVRAMKEKMCYVLLNPNKELAKEGLADRTAEYTLPDGSVIQVGPERHRAPEVLFNPSLIGSEYMGVHEALSVAIAKSDIDIRKTLYGKIFLAGGNTLLSGFTDRLLNEVKRQAPKETKVRIHAPKSEDRQTTTWLGGSILASLNSFSSMVVSKKEYDEDRSIIHRKTF